MAVRYPQQCSVDGCAAATAVQLNGSTTSTTGWHRWHGGASPTAGRLWHHRRWCGGNSDATVTTVQHRCHAWVVRRRGDKYQAGSSFSRNSLHFCEEITCEGIFYWAHFMKFHFLPPNFHLMQTLKKCNFLFLSLKIFRTNTVERYISKINPHLMLIKVH